VSGCGVASGVTFSATILHSRLGPAVGIDYLGIQGTAIRVWITVGNWRQLSSLRSPLPRLGVVTSLIGIVRSVL